MKGDVHIPWVVIAFLLALILLGVGLYIVLGGRSIIGQQAALTDLRACCENYRVSGSLNTNCRLSDGTTQTITDLAGQTGIIDKTSDPPSQQERKIKNFCGIQ